jgi:hypothetical protein
VQRSLAIAIVIGARDAALGKEGRWEGSLGRTTAIDMAAISALLQRE